MLHADIAEYSDKYIEEPKVMLIFFFKFKLNNKYKLESEILGSSEASFSKFVLCKKKYIFGILSPSYMHNQSFECTKTCIWYVCICVFGDLCF